MNTCSSRQCSSKKYHCPDCHFCQFCVEIRCIACRREPKPAKLTATEQIRRYEELNSARGNPAEPIFYKE